MNLPVLYSFRRCPYCMRAHMALKASGLEIELREVELATLPEQLLRLSPNATVPLLVLADGQVFDESWDIVKWALRQNDPGNWLGDDEAFVFETEMLVETNDFSFKEDLDRYKYADRHPERSQLDYRNDAEEFIEELEQRLERHPYLLGDSMSIADISVMPFIRQFAMVDQTWFDSSPYPQVHRWLNDFLESAIFTDVFRKHPIWQTGAPVTKL